MSLLQEQGKCYEAIVVGAGIQGSATAYYLTNKLLVKDVLLLEQVQKATYPYLVQSIHSQ